MNQIRFGRCLFVGLLSSLVLLLVVSFAHAQTVAPTATTQTITGPAIYAVQPGDTVWGLSNDGWRQIEAANSALFSQPGRHFTVATTGGPGLRINPGENLRIPAGVTITFRHRAAGTMTPVDNTPIVLAPTPSLTAGEVRDLIAGGLQPLWWLLLLLPLLLLVGLYMLYRAIRDRMDLNERNAEARQAALMRELAEMEQRRRADEVRRDGLIFALFYAVVDMFTIVSRRLRGLRHDIREVHREVLDARLEQQPQFHVVDLEAAFAGEPRRRGQNRVPPGQFDAHNLGDDVDFVEVHRSNGERFSLDVVHGSNLAPMDNGVHMAGNVVLLDEDAARARRDELAILRQERGFRDLAGV